MSRSLKVLYAEDHVDTAYVVAKLLGSRGHDVVLAGTYREAVAALESGSFDVILTDIDLADKSGLDLVREIRGRGLRMRCVAMSGHGGVDEIRKALAVGFDDYLIKPVTTQCLYASIEATALHEIIGESGSRLCA